MIRQSNIFKTFINYRSQLVNAVRGIVSADDIDDIVQETFVKSYQAELKQDISYERTYMLKTARNLALNHASKSAQKLNTSIEELEPTSYELNTASLEKQFESKERFLHFCRAIDALSSEVKRVFLLKKVYGLSQRDIAERLQLSESTVEKHVAKGLKHCSLHLQALAESDKQQQVG